MPFVLWSRRSGRRELLGYTWERPGYLVKVAPADFLEVITHQGFDLVDADDLTQVGGVTEALQEELHMFGITRFDELAEMAQTIPAQLSVSLKVGLEMVAQWQAEALSLSHT